MVTMKLGQSSSNEVSDLQQQHFDLGSRIHEILSTVSLDVKKILVSRLPNLVDEIKSEMTRRDADV